MMIVYAFSVVWLVVGLALTSASLLLNQKISGTARLILGFSAGLLFVTAALPMTVLVILDPLVAFVAVVPFTLVAILPLQFLE